MARPLRIDVPDGVYHVTSRGLERRAVVRDDRDRTRWLDLLAEVATRCDWRVLAWALMGNHFHLYLRTPNADLSAGMHDLNSGYATGFNRRHGRMGPLLQGRFKAVLVERGYHAWELSRYIHLNPVRAGLAARPEAYPWSSCAAYLGRRAPPQWLAWQEVLCEHGRTLRAARREYVRFLAEGLAARIESPLRDAVASSILGSASFVERTRRWLQDRLPDRDVPAARALREHVSVSKIAAEVARVTGVPAECLRQRGRWGNDARAVAVYLSRRLTPRPLAHIGSCFGGVKGSAVAIIVRGIAHRRMKERRLNSLLSALEASLVKDQTSKT